MVTPEPSKDIPKYPIRIAIEVPHCGSEWLRVGHIIDQSFGFTVKPMSKESKIKLLEFMIEQIRSGEV